MTTGRQVESELKPQSMEDTFKDSPNDVLRNIALNIFALKKDANDRVWHGAFKLVSSTLASVLATKLVLNQDLPKNDDLQTAFYIVGAASILMYLGIGDLAKSFHSRGESNALTTVLAAEAVAQSK